VGRGFVTIKITLQQTQCDEIASGMIQLLTELMFDTLPTMPRNDGENINRVDE
jgi:succinyl-CoA synthetase beta subunit